jgi:hypothetical protein
MVVPEEPQIGEDIKDEEDPCLDGGGGLILVAWEIHMAEVAVLELYPRNVEESKHDRVLVEQALQVK